MAKDWLMRRAQIGEAGRDVVRTYPLAERGQGNLQEDPDQIAIIGCGHHRDSLDKLDKIVYYLA
jgi:hypothetical protein